MPFSFASSNSNTDLGTYALTLSVLFNHSVLPAAKVKKDLAEGDNVSIGILYDYPQNTT